MNRDVQDPIIESIRKAEDRLTNTASVLRFLGQQLVNESDDATDDEPEEEDQRYHFISLVLNLVNTYLYMVNSVPNLHLFLVFCIDTGKSIPERQNGEFLKRNNVMNVWTGEYVYHCSNGRQIRFELGSCTDTLWIDYRLHGRCPVAVLCLS